MCIRRIYRYSCGCSETRLGCIKQGQEHRTIHCRIGIDPLFYRKDSIDIHTCHSPTCCQHQLELAAEELRKAEDDLAHPNKPSLKGQRLEDLQKAKDLAQQKHDDAKSKHTGTDSGCSIERSKKQLPPHCVWLKGKSCP